MNNLPRVASWTRAPIPEIFVPSSSKTFCTEYFSFLPKNQDLRVLRVILNTLEGTQVMWAGSLIRAALAEGLGQPMAQIAPSLSTIRLPRASSVKVERHLRDWSYTGEGSLTSIDVLIYQESIVWLPRE